MPLEIAVFDYVAGHLSGAKKQNFETLLKRDAALQQAVDNERALRESLNKSDDTAPVAMSNFDDLLAKIDAERDVDRSGDADTYVESDEAAPQTDKVSAFPFSRSGRYRIAASLVIFGLIGLMVVNFVNYATAPSFETLSDQEASNQIEFVELATQGRLAKMVLSDELDHAQIVDVLHGYKLTAFESGTRQHTAYVFAQKAITESDLALWRADPRIDKVNVFSENNEK